MQNQKKITSIIIPTKNAIHFLERCILSILSTVDRFETPIEIIVIDNGSSDGVEQFAKKYKNFIKYYQVDSKSNFSEMNNIGVKKSNGDYLLFLNNDTEMIQKDWLSKTIEIYESNRPGILGFKQVYPWSNTIYHAGMVFDWNLNPTHLYPDEKESFAGVNKTRKFQVLNGACFFISKEIFNLVHGFDEKYVFGFEDCDLCLKVKKAGFDNLYTPDVKLIHFGQGSGSRAHFDKNNLEYFKSKWSDFIYSDIENYYKQDNYFIKHKVDRIFGLLKKYASNLKITQRHESKSKKLYIDILNNNSSFDQINRKILENLKSNKNFISPSSEKTPDGKVCLSWSHYWDHYLLDKNPLASYVNFFAVNYEFDKNKSEIDPWTENLKNINCIYLPISKFCHNFLVEAGVNKEKIVYCPLGYSPEIDRVPEQSRVVEKIKILSVVNSHDPNRIGVDLLFNLISKLNKKTISNSEFYIKDYGSDNPSNYIKNEINKLIKLGINVVYDKSFVSKTDLIKLYKSSDLFISTFRGEGFGMKILDAMACGLPVIAPNYGGVTDFSKYGELISLPFKKVKMGECLDTDNYPLTSYKWCEINVNDSVEILEKAIFNYKDLSKKAKSKSKEVKKNFNWEKTTEIISKTAENLYNKIENRAILEIKEEKIDLTVLCNTYNSEKRIEKFVNLFLEQKTNLNWELLIVDDGSTDSTKKVCLALVKKHSNVRYVRFDHIGPAAIRNRGIIESRGEVIIMVGDDIIPIGSFINTHNQFHTSDGLENHFLIGHTEWASEFRNSLLQEFMTKFGGIQFSYEHFRNMLEIDYRFLYTSNLSFRKKYIVENNIFLNESFIRTGYEDTEWGYRLMKHGAKFFYNRKIEALHKHGYDINELISRQIGVGKNAWLASTLCPPIDKYINSKFLIDVYKKYKSKVSKKKNLLDGEIDNLKKIIETKEKIINSFYDSSTPELGNSFYYLTQMLSSLHQDYWSISELARLNGMMLPIISSMSQEGQLQVITSIKEKHYFSSHGVGFLSRYLSIFKSKIKENHFLYSTMKRLKGFSK